MWDWVGQDPPDAPVPDRTGRSDLPRSRSPACVPCGSSTSSSKRAQGDDPRRASRMRQPRLRGASVPLLTRPRHSGTRRFAALRSGQKPLALSLLARGLSGSANGLGLFADPPFGRLLVGPPLLHLAEDALALHPLLEHAESLIDIVVAHENLQKPVQSNVAPQRGSRRRSRSGFRPSSGSLRSTAPLAQFQDTQPLLGSVTCPEPKAPSRLRARLGSARADAPLLTT